MEKQLIDNAFYVQGKKWGTWQSYCSEGKPLITSLNEEECIRTTRWYLKQKQESAFDKIETKVYDDVVGEKL